MKNELMKSENTVSILQDKSIQGIKNFKEACEILADLFEKPIKFVAGAMAAAKTFGVNDPHSAMRLCWDMTPLGGGAEPKTSAIVGHLLSKGGIEKSFKIIHDIEYVYYYYDGLFSDLVKHYVVELVKKNPSLEKPIPKIEDFVKKVVSKNLHDERNIDTEEKKEDGSLRYVKTSAKVILKVGDKNIAERKTTLEGTRIHKSGKVDTRQHRYYLSTAINLGLYINKSGEVKQAWNNLSQMMQKRCAKELAMEIAPDIAHNYENEYDHESDIIAEKELEEEGTVTVINVPTKEVKEENKSNI